MYIKYELCDYWCKYDEEFFYKIENHLIKDHEELSQRPKSEWLALGLFWCSVVTSLTFSSNLSNFEKNPRKNPKNFKNFKNPNEPKNFRKLHKKNPKNIKKPKNFRKLHKKSQKYLKQNIKKTQKNCKFFKKNQKSKKNIYIFF